MEKDKLLEDSAIDICIQKIAQEITEKMMDKFIDIQLNIFSKKAPMLKVRKKKEKPPKALFGRVFVQ